MVPAQLAVPAAHEKLSTKGITDDATMAKLDDVIKAVMGCSVRL